MAGKYNSFYSKLQNITSIADGVVNTKNLDTEYEKIIKEKKKSTKIKNEKKEKEEEEEEAPPAVVEQEKNESSDESEDLLLDDIISNSISNTSVENTSNDFDPLLELMADIETPSIKKIKKEPKKHKKQTKKKRSREETETNEINNKKRRKLSKKEEKDDPLDIITEIKTTPKPSNTDIFRQTPLNREIRKIAKKYTDKNIKFSKESCSIIISSMEREIDNLCRWADLMRIVVGRSTVQPIDIELARLIMSGKNPNEWTDNDIRRIKLALANLSKYDIIDVESNKKLTKKQLDVLEDSREFYSMRENIQNGIDSVLLNNFVKNENLDDLEDNGSGNIIINKIEKTDDESKNFVTKTLTIKRKCNNPIFSDNPPRTSAILSGYYCNSIGNLDITPRYDEKKYRFYTKNKTPKRKVKKEKKSKKSKRKST